MNNINYIQVVKGSQFYTELEQVKYSLELLKSRLDKLKNIEYKNLLRGEEYTEIYISSTEEDLEYILKGLGNTIEKGYKLIENG